MANYKQLFMTYMDCNNVKYTDVLENVVRVAFTGDNMKSIPIFVTFDEDSRPSAALRCWEIGSFKDKVSAGLILCNELNRKYRWIKFFLDEDNDIVSQCDAVLDEESGGSICLELVSRMASITDEAYPNIMRALWGDN